MKEKNGNDDDDDDIVDEASWTHVDAVPDCLTPDQMQAYYNKYLKNSRTEIKISVITENYVDDGTNTLSMEQLDDLNYNSSYKREIKILSKSSHKALPVQSTAILH